jgi:proteasome component ECM29
VIEKLNTRLQELISAAKQATLKEKAINALAHLTIGSPDLTAANTKFIFDSACGGSDQRWDVSLLMSAGEALASMASGWRSLSLRRHLDLECFTHPDPIMTADRIAQRPDDSAQFLNRLFEGMSLQRPPVERKSCCIWLLCLVKFCGDSMAVRDRLTTIHSAFSSMLNDRDEFAQETASMGIGLVYALGGEDLRQQMVRSLLSGLTENPADQTVAQRLQNVTGETQLFEPGTIGTAPDGSQLSTYKELCSLASEMNQPDLVYRFMHLASHNQLWRSRVGSAFGVAQIMGKILNERCLNN